MREPRVAIIFATLLLGGALIQALAGDGPPVTLVRNFTPADRAAARYHYVPFDVPEGTASLRITYQYDRADGENVIDLGLFEPGSLDLGSRAFRGYSGGAHVGLTIDSNGATPGYRPGPLPAGRWHVLLGLYKVRPAGVDVTIDIETPPGVSPAAPKAVGPLALPEAEGLRWYVGALHTHTRHSDGAATPSELMQLAGETGFDFVAITDHNNTTHRYELGPQLTNRARPLWIVGEEVTTPGGHASVWGLDDDEWVDFRVSPDDGRIAELVAAAHRYGALFSINHPESECVGCRWAHDIVEGIDGIEISNGRHGEVERALAMWDTLLGSGRRITAVGSSDWHSAATPIDVANVRVYAPSLTQDGILGAIRRGHVIVMRSARDRTPDIVVLAGGHAARIGESLNVAPGTPITVQVDAPGLAGARLSVVANGKPASPVVLDGAGRTLVERMAEPGYVRFELYATDGMLVAVTNPVYLVRP